MTQHRERGNRLTSETSPYLQQHATNPVDWHPWGAEAFELAERDDRPVFLSIGYSACHWCHVMAHESFDDRAIADYTAALQLKSRLASALYGRGMARLRKGSVAAGNADIEAAQKIDPDVGKQF